LKWGEGAKPEAADATVEMFVIKKPVSNFPA